MPIHLAHRVSWYLFCPRRLRFRTPPTVEVNWQDTIRGTILPEPLGAITVDLKTSPSIEPSLFVIVAHQSIQLSVDDLTPMGELELTMVTYSDPSVTNSGEVEYFEVLVLFGAPYKVRNAPCEIAQNFTWEKDLAVFRADREFNVIREIVSFRELDECET